MRPVLAIALFVGFAGLVAAQEKKYESKAGAYAVAFPDKPTVQSAKANDTEVHIAVSFKGTTVFMVTHSDLAEADVKKAKPKDLLRKGEAGLVSQFKASILESKEREFGKHPALEVTAEKEKTQYRVLIVLVGNRVYQVMAIGSKEQVTGKDADAFFKSFEITK
jgi:hypothetical protein